MPSNLAEMVSTCIRDFGLLDLLLTGMTLPSGLLKTFVQCFGNNMKIMDKQCIDGGFLNDSIFGRMAEEVKSISVGIDQTFRTDKLYQIAKGIQGLERKMDWIYSFLNYNVPKGMSFPPIQHTAPLTIS